VDTAYRKLLRKSIDELVEIAVVLDEPVRGEYALALVKLGQRSRTLFAGIRKLHASRTPLAARMLLRPMIDINILVRFLRRDPFLHTALWTVEAERSTVTMHEEVMGSPELRERLGEDPLPAEEAEARAADVAAIRAVGVAAGLPIKNGSLVPSLPAQLKVIDEPAANSAYAFGFRIGSWDVHTGARSFVVGDLGARVSNP
jgi:hypothetical protein